MNGMVSFYNSDEHTIIGGDIPIFCAGLVEHIPGLRGKLFLVRYNRRGTFVIAQWLAGSKDIFVDVMNLGSSLGNFTREKAHELRQRLFAPLSVEEIGEASAKAESDFHHNMQDYNEEEGERLAKCETGE